MIEELKRKKGIVYRARIYGADGYRKSKIFPNKTLAKEWERRVLRERDEHEATGLTVNDTQSFGEFAQRWLKEKVQIRLSTSTQVSYERVLRIHLLPLFGQIALKDLRVDHANRLVVKLKNGNHAPRGINIIVGVFQGILNDAVEWQCLAKNPLFRYKPVKEPEQDYDYWTAPEIQQFLNQRLHDPYYALYVVALNTGMRRGEICALKWDRVDFARNQIVVNRSLGRYGLKESTKTGRKRQVPMSPVVKVVLQKLWPLQKGPFIFCDDSGNPIDAHHFPREFQRAQKEAGFTKLIRFHDLRHTFASHFMMNGGNIYDLQKILGHSSLEMTQRYAHMSPDHLVNAIQIVGFQAEGTENVAMLTRAVAKVENE